MPMKTYDLLVEIATKLPHSDKKRQIYFKFNKDFYNGKNQTFLKIMIRDSL